MDFDHFFKKRACTRHWPDNGKVLTITVDD